MRLELTREGLLVEFFLTIRPSDLPSKCTIMIFLLVFQDLFSIQDYSGSIRFEI